MITLNLSGEAGILVQYSGTLLNSAMTIDKNLIQPPTDKYIYFTAGVATLLVGKKITGATSGNTAQVAAIVVTSGALSTSDGAGIIFLSNVSGVFQSGENLQIGGATKAVSRSTVLSCVTLPATSASIAIETNSIRYTSTGATPTNSAGTPASLGLLGPATSWVTLTGWDTIRRFAFINAVSGSLSTTTIQFNY